MLHVLSASIPKHSALNLFHGFQYAKHINYPLTCHATILWSRVAGYPKTATIEEQSSFAFQKMDKVKRRFSDFCRYRSIPNHLAYVLENPMHSYTSNLDKKVHAHVACHVPVDHHNDFTASLQDWVFDGQVEPRNLTAVKVMRHTDHRTVMRYLLKSSDPSAVVTLTDGDMISLQELTLRAAPNVAVDPSVWDQGLIHGKRCGLSRQLDAAARSRAGFLPTVH
jgi:hypothetical protein